MDTVLEASAIASNARPDLRLVIAGTLPKLPKYETYFSELKARADEIMPGRVDLIADVDAATFDELYAQSNLVCFGLRHATQSTTFYRALAHGKPVIATNVGGVAEVIERENLGRVVPVDDPAAMARAIEELLEQGASEAKRAAVRSYAAGRTWDANAREHLALYDELTGRAPLKAAA
jgi:glycosyltransferase involved in cell wall biosynthesis